MGADRRHAWTARLVTYGLVVVVAFGVVEEVEAWPVTSYRLFSQVRTGQTIMLELVAIGANDRRTVVRPHGKVGAAIRHQYRELPALDLAARRNEVRGWLAAGGIDADGPTIVRLERVTRQLDLSGGPATELSRVVVVEVVL